MKKPDVILWDWDGTLLNSRVASRGALFRLGRETGVEVTEDDVTEVVGGHMVDFWYRHYGPNPIPEVEKFIGYYQELSRKVGLFPEVIDILDFVKKLNIPQIVVSNKNQDIILAEAERLGIAAYFKKIVGTINHGIGKPEKAYARVVFGPDIPPNILIIGDGASDMQFAKNINAVGLLVRPSDWPADFEYQYRVNNLAEVKAFLIKQNWV